MRDDADRKRVISIHAPLRGRRSDPFWTDGANLFQSTPPCGGDSRQHHKGVAKRSISIHAPLRGRQKVRSQARVRHDFNPRPLAGATVTRAWTMSRNVFQSTPPCGGDDDVRQVAGYSTQFQSTPPCGGDWAARTAATLITDFNPRPLAGATQPPLVLWDASIISIHAPLRGRRRLPRSASRWRTISIHAPLRGRRPWRRSSGGTADFNPRPLAGATAINEHYGTLGPISIHAPLRGRHIRAGKFKIPALFQSTPPCGGDLIHGFRIIAQDDFNPRPLAGATRMKRRAAEKFAISIHAPLRGRPACRALQSYNLA